MKHQEDIYSVLNEVIMPDTRELYADCLTKKDCERLSEEEQKIFILLKNLASLGVKYTDGEVEFSPAIEIYGKGRSFGLQDMTEDDYMMLEKVEVSRLPVLFQARVADILWTERKDYKIVPVAIKAYHELYNITFDLENWPTCLRYIKRSVTLAAKTGSKRLYDEYRKELFDKVIEVNGEDKYFFSISVIEFLILQKWKVCDPLIIVLDNIIAKSEDNVHKVELAYELKSKLFSKKQDNDAVMENYLQLALFYERSADKVWKKDVQGMFNAERYLQKAVFSYRKGGSAEKGESAHRKLLDLQKQIPQFMIPITAKCDSTKNYEKIVQLFENLSFKEHIIRIVQCVPFYKKEDLKKKVLKDAVNPIACMFGGGIKNGKGQTLIDIPSLDIHNPESNINVLEMHMHQNALMMEEIRGGFLLKIAVDLLNERFEYTKNDLRFIVEGNPIIPEGRENIFLSALYYGLKGDIYVSLHILAPQTEKMFRYIAENAGGIMYTLENNGSSQEKLLTSIFDTPELVECYDNDILFMFKGLMNEKAGANIRNEIAHGIMSENKGNSGVARFFLCAVLKLLSFTSKEYYKILQGSDALKRIVE